MQQNIPVEKAQELLISRTPSPSEEEACPLAQAYGRVLARDLASRVNHPDAADTALDGYAVYAADARGASQIKPVRLRIIGESPAGQPFSGRVEANQAVVVFTGTPVPEGADAIIRIENTERRGNEVLLYTPASPSDIRPKGDDLRTGTTYLKAGDLLTPGRVGLAAAMGFSSVFVRPRPKIGILSTGDEVVEPGEPLPHGGVYNSNSYSLAGLVLASGGEPVLLGQVGDRPQALSERIAQAEGLELLLTSGGVSMGEYDIVRKLLETEGNIHFWKVLVRPGGPLLFGSWHHLPVLGLPGNPVSAMVTFYLFGRPMLFRRLGRSDPPHQQVKAVAMDRFKGAGLKTAYRRGLLSYGTQIPMGYQVHSTGNQSSGVLRSMSEGNALVVVPPYQEIVDGDLVTAIRFTE